MLRIPGTLHRAALTTAAVAAVATTSLALLPAASAAGAASDGLEPVNPVTVAVDGHPANSGFLAFVENDVTINGAESEGTIALGGDLHLKSSYNVEAGSAPQRPTYQAPGDDHQVYLHVGGGIDWADPGATVNIENGGFTKVADPSTYTAYDRDGNGAAVNYRLVPKGDPYDATPHIDGRTAQTPASIGAAVPTRLIDVPSAFATYRDLTQQMASCPQTAQLTDDRGASIPTGFPKGTRGRLTLEPDRTNVLTLSAEDLGNLAEITFANQPTASQPLLVNVTGKSFDGSVPNLAGVSGDQAPYILWNFADATDVTVESGDSLEGSLYAPNASLTWLPASNIEGNVIASVFNHGGSGPGSRAGELHDFPFDTTLSCTSDTPSAHLTLVKKVVNDDGGSATPADWTLSADGPLGVEGTTGSDAVTDVEVPAGVYTLTESDGPAGYDPSGWSCDGGDLDGDQVTVASGADVTCTITNDDTPGPAPGPSPSPSPNPTPAPSPTPPSDSGVSGTSAVGPTSTSSPSSDDTLPNTGGANPGWLAAGLGLVVGGALLVATRRRRS